MFPEKEIITGLPVKYQVNRSENHALHDFDFDRLICKMKHERKWKNGEMNKMILLRNPMKKVLLVLLHAKSEITSYQVNDSADFKILEGRLELHFLEESFILVRGELLKLIEKTSYRIDAMEDTAFLMILKSQNQIN
jgi:hypothetical protein